MTNFSPLAVTVLASLAVAVESTGSMQVAKAYELITGRAFPSSGGMRGLSSSSSSSSDSSSSDSDDENPLLEGIDDACLDISCTNGGNPASEVFVDLRFDGIVPFEEPFLVTDTPISAVECVEFCEESAMEQGIDFDTVYVGYFNFGDLSSCDCHLECVDGYFDSSFVSDAGGIVFTVLADDAESSDDGCPVATPGL